VKFGRNGDPIVPAKYDDPLSKSIYYNGKAYSTTPARATDEEIEDDLAQMRKTWDGKPYVKPASPKEVLPEFDDYGYKGRIVKKPKSKLESDIRNGPPTGEEFVHGSQSKDEETGSSIETSDTRDAPLNINERFWGSKFGGDEEESSVTTSDTRYKTFLGEVSQPNQAPGEEDESSLAKSNSPGLPLLMKKQLQLEVVQNSLFKVEAEILLEACNAGNEPLPMKEAVQDNQSKDKDAESSVTPATSSTLAPISCATETGIPATSKKRKISEISELTNDSLTSPLDRKMPQTEDEEGPPHKKLRAANGAVNLPIPPEKPATPKKVIPTRAKKPTARKARNGGGGRARNTARACKASSAANKAAAPVVPVRAETPSANAEKPTGEQTVVTKSVAVVVVTRAASRGITGKDKSPTTTVPEVEGSTDETITDQENNVSSSSDGGDNLEKDGSYAPVAPRRRRVPRKARIPVAPRKLAAPNKGITSKEEKTSVQQEDEPSAAIPEVGAGLEIDSTKSAAVPKSRGVKRKVTGLEDEIAVQQEAGPVTHGVDAALTTETPAPPPRRRVRRKAAVPKDAIIEPSTILKEDATLTTESGKPAPRPRKRARKEVKVPEDKAIVGEGAQQPARPEADAARTTQKPARVPTRRPRKRNATAPEEAITGAISAPTKTGPTLTKENSKPVAVPKRRGRNANALEAEATAQKKARNPLASPHVDAVLTAGKPAPAPLGRDTKRKAISPEEVATGPPIAPKVSTSLAEIAKPVANTRQRRRRNIGAHTVEAGIEATTGSLATPKVSTTLSEIAKPAADTSQGRSGNIGAQTVGAGIEAATGPPTAPKVNTTLAEIAKPAADTRQRRSGNIGAQAVGAGIEAATGPPTAPKVNTTLAEIAKPVAGTRVLWRRNFGAHTVETIHPDTGLKKDNTKPSAATRNRGVKRKATQLEDKVANQQEAEAAPTPVVDASPAAKITKLSPTPVHPEGEKITALRNITTAPLDAPKADATIAQGSAKPAASPRNRRKKKVKTPEAGAATQQEAGPPSAPGVDSTLAAEKPAPVPTIGSPRRETAAPEEHVPRTAVLETQVGAVEDAAQATASIPPAPAGRPRYRIPAEGSRKSTRIKAQNNELK
jgi:hypothetical protein